MNKKISKITAIILSTAIIIAPGNNFSASAKHMIKSGGKLEKYIATAVGIPAGIIGLALVCYGSCYLWKYKNNSSSNDSPHSDNFFLGNSSIVSSSASDSSSDDSPLIGSCSSDLSSDDSPLISSCSSDLSSDDSPLISSCSSDLSSDDISMFTSFLGSTSSITPSHPLYDDILTKLLKKANLPKNTQKSYTPNAITPNSRVKITLIGGCQTGKTAFGTYLTFDTIPEYKKTFVVTHYVTRLDDVTLEIFDLPSDDIYLRCFNPIISDRIISSDIIIFFIDPTDPQYIENLIKFYDITTEYTDKQKTVAVVINTYKYDNNKWTESRNEIFEKIVKLNLCAPIYEWHNVNNTFTNTQP